MDDESDTASKSVVQLVPPIAPRKLVKVPFVELADGRVQGVVSSGSDIARVYVSWVSFTDGEHLFGCSTNNNRPCGGAMGNHLCKHLDSLLAEAVTMYGYDRVARYLKIESPNPDTHLRFSLTAPCIAGSRSSSLVFSRFLRYLTYLELPVATAPLAELHWFPTTGVK